MGLLNALLGNASKSSIEDAMKHYGYIMAQGEEILAAYQLVRDMFIFTPYRLILIDIQGITGKRRDVQSVPYKSIQRFSIETAGHLDLDAKLSIWLDGMSLPIEKDFSGKVNIYEVQGILAEAIVKFGH